MLRTIQQKLLVSVCAAVTIGMVAASAAAADTYTVNDPGDAPDAAPDGVCEATAATGDCTLRAAIDEANSTLDAQDEIGFDAGVDLITVATQIEIKAPVAITGNGAGGTEATVVSGGDQTRVFDVATGADTRFAAILVEDGLAGADGGGGAAIRTAAPTTLDDVTVASSAVDDLTASGYGAGISSTDSLAELSLIDSRVLDNTINVDDGIRGAGGGGAGISALGPLSVTDSTVSGNSISNLGPAFAQGGGIRAEGALTVLRSTIDANSITGSGAAGAAIYGGIGAGSRAITNSTISANTTPLGSGAGAVAIGADATLTAVTFAANVGDRADLDVYSGTVSAGNTIFGSEGACATSGGAISPGLVGHNLDRGTTCGLGTLNGNQENADPMLAPLALNAPGATRTQAPLPGSPAIDAASGGCAGLVSDQRGFARSQGGPICDIGAYETQHRLLTTTRTGLGSGSVTGLGIACGGDCAQSYVQGAGVVLTATPASGSEFAGWSGCDSVAGQICTVAMGSDRMVAASFALTPPPPSPPATGGGTFTAPPTAKKCRKGHKRVRGKCRRITKKPA